MGDPRNWHHGCTVCGSSVLIVNAKPTLDGPGCPQCADDVNRNPFDAEGRWHGMVASEAGWCGCDQQEHLDRIMLAYLDQPDTILNYEGDAGMLLAFLADDLGWTEHGGGVGGSWLTDEGKEAVTNLRAKIAEYDERPTTMVGD